MHCADDIQHHVAKDDAQRIRDEIAREREAWEAERELKEAELKKQNEANEKKHGELSAKEDELLGKEQELRMSERRLENERDELPERVKDQVAEYKDSLSAENEEYKKEIQRLRDSLLTQTELLGAFEQLRRQLGDKDPAEVLRDLNAKTDEIIANPSFNGQGITGSSYSTSDNAIKNALKGSNGSNRKTRCWSKKPLFGNRQRMKHKLN